MLDDRIALAVAGYLAAWAGFGWWPASPRRRLRAPLGVGLIAWTAAILGRQLAA